MGFLALTLTFCRRFYGLQRIHTKTKLFKKSFKPIHIICFIKKLKRVDQSEQYLQTLGFFSSGVRWIIGVIRFPQYNPPSFGFLGFHEYNPASLSIEFLGLLGFLGILGFHEYNPPILSIISSSFLSYKASLSLGRTLAGIVWCFLGAVQHYMRTRLSRIHQSIVISNLKFCKNIKHS